MKRTLAAMVVALPVLCQAQSFTETTAAAGLVGSYGAVIPGDNLQALMTAGIAVADYDDDGHNDIFWSGGTTKPCRLFHNNGDGTFTDVAYDAGVAYRIPSAGPLWFDHDGDGDLDLFLTTYENQLTLDVNSFSTWNPANFIGIGIDSTGDDPGAGATRSDPAVIGVVYRNFLFDNQGDGTFEEIGEAVGLWRSGRFGASAGDLNGDGRLDLVTGTWNFGKTRFFTNMGGHFRLTTPTNVAQDPVWGFTPTIVDIDQDGDADVLMANDLTSSRFYRNDGDNVFTDVTAAAGLGTDENGMGSAVGDYDNDGDLDWFVTAIYSPFDLVHPAYRESGNRLYRNDGRGIFTDVTDIAGVRNGNWGWGAQFADIDNDGDLDIVHANGWTEPDPSPLLEQFLDDALRIFVNNGDGTFTESASAFGLDDLGQGRGLVVTDFDRDGALDILVANYGTGLSLWSNDAATVPGHWVEVALRTDADDNRFAVGARLVLSTATVETQVRVVTCGNNFLSAAPLDAWFGIGPDTTGTLTVHWPSGQTSIHPITGDQRVVINEP